MDSDATLGPRIDRVHAVGSVAEASVQLHGDDVRELATSERIDHSCSLRPRRERRSRADTLVAVDHLQAKSLRGGVGGHTLDLSVERNPVNGLLLGRDSDVGSGELRASGGFKGINLSASSDSAAGHETPSASE